MPSDGEKFELKVSNIELMSAEVVKGCNDENMGA